MITNICVLICTGVFIYIHFINKEDKLTTALRLGAFYPPQIRERKEYWRFITCHFIHIDFLHFICGERSCRIPVCMVQRTCSVRYEKWESMALHRPRTIIYFYNNFHRI